MGDGLAEHVVVDVGVGIDMDQADRAVLLGDGAQHRQGDGVIAAQRQRYAVVAQHLIVELLDDVHALGQVEGVDRHIADVRHLQAIEGRGAGGHVVGAQHARFIADLTRAETCARTVGGTDVQRNADEGGVQAFRGFLSRQTHHGGRAAETWHVVAAQRLIELAHLSLQGLESLALT